MEIPATTFKTMKTSLIWAMVALAGVTCLRADAIFSTLDGPQTGGYQVVGATAQNYPPESVAASFESDWPFLFTGAQVQVFAIQGAAGTGNPSVSSSTTVNRIR